MKRSLFLLSVLAVSFAEAEVAYPDGFSRQDVASGTDFVVGDTRTYNNNKYAFVLGADTELVVDTTYGGAQMRNGYIYITSDSANPVNLSMSNLAGGTGRILLAELAGTSSVMRTYDWKGLNNVSISGNTVSITSTSTSAVIGGALAGKKDYQSFSISDNFGVITLAGNKVTSSVNTVSGAVISSTGGYSSITIDNNAGGVSVINNTAETTASSKSAMGGAMRSATNGAGISISNNRGLVNLSGNKAESVHISKGGLATIQNTFTVSGNTVGVRIDNNSAYSTKGVYNVNWLADGGAISGYNDASSGVKILNNKLGVSISGNNAVTTGSGASGGAMSVAYVDISGNTGNLEIKNNYTSAAVATTNSATKYLTSKGGAFFLSSVAAANSPALCISGNESVTISGNYADAKEGSAAGGAIYTNGAYSKVVISGNKGAVNITDNYVSGVQTALGGAIYAFTGVCIEGNESVKLAGNYEKVTNAQTGDSTYRLRSIYQYNTSTTTDATQLENAQFRLMAAKGKSIEIQDSVFSNRKKIDVVFNGDYTDASGTTQKGEGTIRFTGEYTKAVLEELKGVKLDDDADEVVASRLSEFASSINLMGGRLELAELVCLKGVGFTAAEGSGAVLSLQNASFTNTKTGSTAYDNGAVTFKAGTTLELVGTNNTLSAQTLTLEDNSTMKFVLTQDALTTSMLTLDVTGGLAEDVFNNITIELAGELSKEEGVYHLLSLSDLCNYNPDVAWDETKVTLKGAVPASLSWSGTELLVMIAPEPTTSSLSLLALSLLAARRRRR